MSSLNATKITSYSRPLTYEAHAHLVQTIRLNLADSALSFHDSLVVGQSRPRTFCGCSDRSHPDPVRCMHDFCMVSPPTPTNEQVVQFLYGEDGMDGVWVEKQRYAILGMSPEKFARMFELDNTADDFGELPGYHGEQTAFQQIIQCCSTPAIDHHTLFTTLSVTGHISFVCFHCTALRPADCAASLIVVLHAHEF